MWQVGSQPGLGGRGLMSSDGQHFSENLLETPCFPPGVSLPLFLAGSWDREGLVGGHTYLLEGEGFWGGKIVRKEKYLEGLGGWFSRVRNLPFQRWGTTKLLVLCPVPNVLNMKICLQLASYFVSYCITYSTFLDCLSLKNLRARYGYKWNATWVTWKILLVGSYSSFLIEKQSAEVSEERSAIFLARSHSCLVSPYYSHVPIC